LLTHDAAAGIDVLDRLVNAVLELRTECGIRTGNRAGHAHLDLSLCGAGEGDRCAKRQAECGNSLHTHLPFMKKNGTRPSGLLRRRDCLLANSSPKPGESHPESA